MPREVLIKMYDSDTNELLFTFGEAPWKIHGEIDGLNSIQPSFTTTPVASGYGVVLNGKQIPERTLSFNVVNVQVNDKDAARSSLTAVIKPGIKEYFLKITYGSKTKVLKKCYISDYKINSGKLNDFIRLSISFMALDPLFYSGSETEFSFNSGSYTAKIACNAPVLPTITLTGASSGDALKLGKNTITVHNSSKSSVPSSLTLDIDSIVHQKPTDLSALAYLSFSTDISKMLLEPGDNSVVSTISGVVLKFYERSWGI